MSLLGILLGGPGPTTAPTPPPPAPTAGSTPVSAPDGGGESGSVANRDAGSSSGGASSGGGSSQTAPALAGAAAAPATEPPAAAWPAASASGPPATSGTPLTAPATRHAFTLRDTPLASEEQEPALALESQRTWRMSDIIAAISGGPRAEHLIEVASRPGPVEPGSLMEAIKAVRPAPQLLQSTRLV